MNVAIVGGGWAGLAAAHRLRRLGHSPHVFEAGRILGGRARRAFSPGLEAHIDNGQHILLGAYRETLQLIKELGQDETDVLHRERLDLRSADGGFRLRAAPLPSPFHLAGALLGAQGLAWGDRLRLVRINSRLKKNNWKTAPGMTVAQWLHAGRQSDRAIRHFWQPLCLAAMNTPLDRACAQLFAHVLRDSLGGPRDASDVLIPKTDLSALWPEQLQKNADAAGKIKIELGRPVRRLRHHEEHVEVDGQHFDAVVLACNASSTQRLLAQLPARANSAPFLSTLTAFSYLPIATITLALERPWGLPQGMLMLMDDPGKQQFGQWLFDSSLLGRGSNLNIVVSDARRMMEHPQQRVIEATITQIKAQTTKFTPMPSVERSCIITEKRATFTAEPGLQRPPNATPWPRVWVAGDWTDTGYPAVLEGAVRSGMSAAAMIAATGAPAQESG